MRTTLTRLRRTWAPASLLGMLALVAVVETTISRREPELTTIWAAAWAEAGRAATTEAKVADVLFLGDSQVMQGVAPGVVTAASGLRARNLAVYKGLAPAAYFLLRRALDAGARPSAICLDGELLPDDPLELTRLWPELLGPAEILDLAATLRDPEYGLELLVARALPSVRMRHEIRGAVESGSHPSDRRANRRRIERHLAHWRAGAGAHIHPADQIGPEDAETRLDADGYAPGWSVHPANAAYVERLLDLADARDIPVLWLIPPVRAEVQARRDQGGLTAGYDAWLRDLHSRHPRLTVLDARRSTYPREALADLTHLNRTGACAFSAAVGELLRRQLARDADAASWVALPPYAPPAEAVFARVEEFGRPDPGVRSASEPGRVQR